MKESINFMYDGISSKDMGVSIAWSGSGLFEENFLPTRRIVEKKIINREKSYLQRVEHDPLSFPLSFFIRNWKDDETLRKIARWFFQDYYKPIIFESNPNRIFYVMFEGDSTLFHNGMEEGYIELTLRCDSPYSYSPEYNHENIEFIDAESEQTVSNEIGNFSNGTHDNTLETSNGLTVDKPLSSWGEMYDKAQRWGDL